MKKNVLKVLMASVALVSAFFVCSCDWADLSETKWTHFEQKELFGGSVYTFELENPSGVKCFVGFYKESYGSKNNKVSAGFTLPASGLLLDPDAAWRKLYEGKWEYQGDYNSRVTKTYGCKGWNKSSGEVSSITSDKGYYFTYNDASSVKELFNLFKNSDKIKLQHNSYICEFDSKNLWKAVSDAGLSMSQLEDALNNFQTVKKAAPGQ